MINKVMLQSPIAQRMLLLFLLSSILPLIVLLFSLTLVFTESFDYLFNYIEGIKIHILIATICYIIALLVITIKNVRQILLPLQKLRSVTREISNQKFNTKLDITTGDEFEDLAQSFNRMSSRLGKQFNELEMIARIDRLILSTLDIDNIVETILIRMKYIVPCDSVSVIITSEKKPLQARCYFRKNSLSTAVSCVDVEFSKNDLTLLKNNSDSLLIEKNSLAPQFLFSLKRHSVAFLLLPIFRQDQLTAVIIFGYNTEPKYSSDDLTNAKDLSHRIAVALSNAAWEDKLYLQAHHDNLTNLPNRLLFQDRLKHALTRAEREKTWVALLFIDLDLFKSINDSLGHEVGDLILIEVAHRLKNNVRNIDTISRLGGDEFTIVLPDLQDTKETANDISLIARKILSAISMPYYVNNQEVNFTCSIGIALFPNDADNFLDLLRHADSAMYYAKTKGKNIYRFYSENFNLLFVA